MAVAILIRTLKWVLASGESWNLCPNLPGYSYK